MLITVTSVSFRDVSTRLMWPRFSAPIVGTTPILLPSPLVVATAARSSAMLETMIMLVAVFGVRVLPVTHFVPELCHSISHGAGKIRVFLEEFRREPIVQPKQVRQHEHLAVTLRSGSDSNRWDAESLADSSRE